MTNALNAVVAARTAYRANPTPTNWAAYRAAENNYYTFC